MEKPVHIVLWSDHLSIPTHQDKAGDWNPRPKNRGTQIWRLVQPKYTTFSPRNNNNNNMTLDTHFWKPGTYYRVFVYTVWAHLISKYPHFKKTASLYSDRQKSCIFFLEFFLWAPWGRGANFGSYSPRRATKKFEKKCAQYLPVTVFLPSILYSNFEMQYSAYPPGISSGIQYPDVKLLNIPCFYAISNIQFSGIQRPTRGWSFLRGVSLWTENLEGGIKFETQI